MTRKVDASPLTLVRRVDDTAGGVPNPDTVPTGFPSVDRILGGGMRRGDLVVLGGDAACGKSALALAIAIRAAAHGHASEMHSAELSADRLTERALAIEGRVRIDDLRRGGLDDAARARVGAAALRLRDLPLQLRTLALTGAPLDTVQTAHIGGPALIVVDSLQSLAPGVQSLDDELASAVRRLKSLALERQVTVLVTACADVASSVRVDARPTIADFGARGAVKQMADVILAVYREEMYADGPDVKGATELIVRKNRNGATGFADLYYTKQFMRFEDLLDPREP